MRPAWVEINLEALKENIRNLRGLLRNSTKVMGVVKADAYGHGAVRVCNILQKEGVRYFAVALLEEGIKLRDNGIKEQILILGYTPEEDYSQLLDYNLTPTIFNYVQAFELNKAAQKKNVRLPIHIKLDTGMGRIGFRPGEAAVNEIINISNLSNIYIEGIYSHFAVADQEDHPYSREQYLCFKDFISELEANGLEVPLKHIANSAALINFPLAHFDLVRAGISLYGIYPDPQMAEKSKLELSPVMEIKAKLSHVKAVSPGTFISYGCTYQTSRGSIIGTVPLGYADGIFRSLSNKAEVLVRGKRCPVVGRICMDQLMVDLTDIKKVQVGDEVVIIGAQGKEKITADEVAEKAGTISYEVVSRIGIRLPKIYIEKQI